MFRSGSTLTSVRRRNPVLCIPSSLIPPSQRNHPSNWVFVFPMSLLSLMSLMSLMVPMVPMVRMDPIGDHIIGIVPVVSTERSTTKDRIVLIVPIATESQTDPDDPIVIEKQADPDDPIVPMLPQASQASRVRIVRIVPVGCFNRSSSSCPTRTVFAGD